MSEPTPGEWVAVKGLNEDGTPEPDRWFVGVPVGKQRPGSGHHLVAVIHNGRPGDTLETEGANARVMAAAPNLLQALMGMVILAERKVEPISVLAQARAAIRKATEPCP